MTKGKRILAGLGVLVLCSVFGASQALGADVTIGGKVLTLTDPPVAVAGATVSVHPAGAPSTTTAGDGSWSLTVSDASDPVLKIGATATTVETYTQFPVTLLMDYQNVGNGGGCAAAAADGTYQYDISAVRTETMATVPSGSCVVLGFALRYASLLYPVTQSFVSGVVVSPTPTAYIDADGVTPCIPPTCNATTASGVWVGIHEGGYSTPYSGTKTGTTFSGGDVTCVADTANVTGLVDDNLPPLP